MPPVLRAAHSAVPAGLFRYTLEAGLFLARAVQMGRSKKRNLDKSESQASRRGTG